MADGRPVAAVAGLGVGARHADTLRSCGCELRLLCDPDVDRARSLAKELGAGGHARDFDAILADPEVELVVVASPDDAHFAQALAALEAGRHVFVEKPMCRTIAELHALRVAWAAHGGRVKLASNLVLRAAPLYRRVRDDVQAGAYGTPYAVDAEYLYGRLEKITGGWRGGIRDYSVMLGGGVHMADLMLWVLGERPHTVRATGNRICTASRAMGFDDFSAAELRFPSGVVGRLTANFGCVQPHQHVFRVYGTGGTFHFDDAGARMYASRSPDRPPVRLHESSRPEDASALVPWFVDAVRTDADIGKHTDDMFAAVSVCVACDQAVATNSETEIEYA
ncbi:putative dehydrogenase [Desulfobaculum xiamenense]|uniref:Putative dehydrogenase n=1 Tax=Desulfobaculum xiamenense TaxID=995050 RepID=A0A846QNW3_9BACT|nr:putative dehydrogenase [Desulfobaculum xiamenense]